MRNDNLTSYAYAGSGDGTTPPELYMAYHASNVTDPALIQPGQTTLLQNVQTQRWCQLRPLPTNTTQIGMICDQPTSATATVMTYTGDGLSYNGVPLVAAAGSGTTLLLENTTSTPVVGPFADNLSLVPSGERDGAAWLTHQQHSCITSLVSACVQRCITCRCTLHLNVKPCLDHASRYQQRQRLGQKQRQKQHQ